MNAVGAPESPWSLRQHHLGFRVHHDFTNNFGPFPKSALNSEPTQLHPCHCVSSESHQVAPEDLLAH